LALKCKPQIQAKEKPNRIEADRVHGVGQKKVLPTLAEPSGAGRLERNAGLPI